MAFPDAASRIVDPFTPKCELHVTWGSVSLKEGDKMTPTVVQGLPKIKFDGQEGKLYCIAFTDPDAPNPTEPKFAEFNHWLTVNVPAPKADGPVEYGDPIVAYVGSAPGQAGGVHRYVFVVYEQPDKLTCDEPRVPIQSGFPPRRSFNSRAFAAKYGLRPIAVKTFLAEWDDMQPELAKRIQPPTA